MPHYCQSRQRVDGSWVSGSNGSLFWMAHVGRGSVYVDPWPSIISSVQQVAVKCRQKFTANTHGSLWIVIFQHITRNWYTGSELFKIIKSQFCVSPNGSWVTACDPLPALINAIIDVYNRTQRISLYCYTRNLAQNRHSRIVANAI